MPLECHPSVNNVRCIVGLRLCLLSIIKGNYLPMGGVLRIFFAIVSDCEIHSPPTYLPNFGVRLTCARAVMPALVPSCRYLSFFAMLGSTEQSLNCR